MHVNFKNSSLLILAITAVVCSRIMFAFFHDPEGPESPRGYWDGRCHLPRVFSSLSLKLLPVAYGVQKKFGDDFHPGARRNELLLGIALRSGSAWMRNLMTAIGTSRQIQKARIYKSVPDGKRTLAA